ncbi:MAG: hypothetical protein IT497_09860 [Ottowia sp.]|nr:hypothetical protein [Ottowia sp.]
MASDKIITLRVTSEQHIRLQKAALLSGVKLATFIKDCALGQSIGGASQKFNLALTERLTSFEYDHGKTARATLIALGAALFLLKHQVAHADLLRLRKMLTESDGGFNRSLLKEVAPELEKLIFNEED